MRRDVQKNKNKQKQELKNKKVITQKSVYSSDGAYMNITTVNLNKEPTDLNIKMPFNFIVRDATNLTYHKISYLCRASDLIILSITGINIELELINVIKRSMPTVLITYEKKFKNIANSIAKSFGSPKMCEFSMLNMILNNLECQNTAIALERPFMIPQTVDIIDNNTISVQGFMKNSLRSNKLTIDGLYTGFIEEVIVDGNKILGESLNIEEDESIYNINKNINTDNNKDTDNNMEVEQNENEEVSAEEIDFESNENESEENQNENQENQFDYQEDINPAVDLITKYSKYKGIRNLSACTFVDQAEDMPEYYKNISFYQNIYQLKKEVKNRELLIPKNKNVSILIKIENHPNICDLAESCPVLFNLFEFEGRPTILNYEFTALTDHLSKDLLIDNGFYIYNTKSIVSRNINSNVFKEEKNLLSGVVSFIGPLLICVSNAFIVVDDFNLFKTIRLFNGYAQNKIFFDCVKLTGKPVKICKSYVVVKGMFYNKEQVEYFSNIQLEAGKGVFGFIKKPLGTKGAFKAYFAQSVKYGQEVKISLYKNLFL